MFRFLIILAALISPTIAYAIDRDNSKAVILAYHRIDEPQHIQSSVSIEQFSTHIEEIKSGNYTALPVIQIVNALKNDQDLPPRTIAITFEGGYRSVYKNAIPLLIENNIPFTIFIAGKSTEIPSHLGWKALRKISKYDGASFGILPGNYKHISHLQKAEATRLINQSRTIFKKHMGFEAQFFSYPYGEISTTLKDIIKTQGFTAAFGLQSGPAHSKSNMLALPRFTITSQYADIDRFRMITNTLPLPISEIEPQNSQISSTLNQIGFTASAKLEQDLKNLSCHISSQEKPNIEILGNRVEIIPAEPITDRTRLNCTLPVHSGDQKQWRWLGMLFH